MTAPRTWWYVLRFGFGKLGSEIEILARCASEEKAKAFRVQRRLSPSVALVRPAPLKLPPGRFTGRSLDEEADVRAGKLVRCFLAVDDT